MCVITLINNINEYFKAFTMLFSFSSDFLYRYMSLEQLDSKDRMIMVIIKKHKRNSIQILYIHSVFIIYCFMYSKAKKQFVVDENKKCSVLAVILFQWHVSVQCYLYKISCIIKIHRICPIQRFCVWFYLPSLLAHYRLQSSVHINYYNAVNINLHYWVAFELS